MIAATNQRIGRSGPNRITKPSQPPAGRIWKFRLWALAASVLLHIIVLAAFAAAKFSRSQAVQGPAPVPTASVSRVRKLIEISPTIPKPKIKTAADKFRSTPLKPLALAAIVKAPKLRGENSADSTSYNYSIVTERFQPAKLAGPSTEFFGSRTDKRRICYVVDCSGSMFGVFEAVRKKLKESVADLQPDQYFSIIFFGDDRLFEFTDGCLLRATKKNKAEANHFIEQIRPAGQTNAAEALQKALRLSGRNGRAQVYYFLTDGFELTGIDDRKFTEKIINVRTRFAPDAKINTIAFWPSEKDRSMLQHLAKTTGGEFVLVTDTDM